MDIMDIDLIFHAIIIALPIVSLMVLRRTTTKLANKISVNMLARMKARRREYAERQLAFSKVMLVSETKTRGKYNIKIGKDNTCHFLFCPEKVTELLEQNLYWSEQVKPRGKHKRGIDGRTEKKRI